MSGKLYEAMLRHSLTPPQKAVMGYLCWRANDYGGDCFPSLPTIERATDLGHRTVQRAIKDLEIDGWLVTRMSAKVGKVFELNAARIMAEGCQSGTGEGNDKAKVGDAAAAPVPERRARGARAAPNTLGKHESTKAARAKPKNNGPLPTGWQPEPFTDASKSRAIVDGWDSERLALEVEKFVAHHGTRDNRFSSWQQAWATWVLNTRSFGDRHGGTTGRAGRAHGARHGGPARPGDGDGFQRAIDRSLGLDDPAASAGRGAAGTGECTGDGRPAHLRLVQS